jgi:hypothetical protein
MITFNENDHQKAQKCIQSLSSLEEISSIHNYDFNGGSHYRILFKLDNSNLEIVPKIHTTFQNNQISEPNIRISGGNA